jgi:hypothetical protein
MPRMPYRPEEIIAEFRGASVLLIQEEWQRTQ